MGVFALVSSTLLPSLRLSYSQGLPFAVYYVTPVYRVPDFVIGAGLATLFLRIGPTTKVAIPSLLIIPVLGFFGHLNEGFMLFNALLLPLVASAIYGMASADQSRVRLVRAFVQLPVVKYMGETSYSFFLLQIPIMLMVDRRPEMFSGVSAPVAFFLLVAANSIAAMLSFHLVEKPGRRVLLGWYWARRRAFEARRTPQATGGEHARRSIPSETN
jgi:peptidoglycan/LPS O-acetylase OafA/YrhL